MSKQRIIPDDLSRMEALCVNIVVQRIKNEILSGRYPGLVIEQALNEISETASNLQTKTQEKGTE